MVRVIVLVVFIVGCIAGVVYLLREKNGGDIRVVWYLSSLTIMISFGVAWLAISANVLRGGEFVGEYGDLLNSFIRFMLDIEKDFLIVTGVACLIILPQCACYVLSGLSGNAKSPMLMSASFSFLVWGVIKSLVIYASILISLGGLYLLGCLSGKDQSSFLISTGLYSLLLAFCIISLYREGEQLARFMGKRMPFLKRVHEWCARKESSGA
ncbi:hypothetical protein [Pseudomonas sp. PA1(2017)]|uniref:hypothetical protein n=1 Tax=Pseudomonas sp. PA1(2017) TaxID=1932113 RepID=UPI000B31C1FC|nr:hypothetical protein [Pseudomonas sp. PA1(2017)]